MPEELTTLQSLEGRLLLAVPKSESNHLSLLLFSTDTLAIEGRLLQASLDLLQGADIQFKRESRLDIALVKNLPLALIFLRASDIPTFVGEGRVDVGITGLDQVLEHDAGVRELARARRETSESSPELGPAGRDEAGGCETVMELGFGACKLQVQAPEKGVCTTGSDLVGRNIATSFPHLATEYFARLELELEGGVPDADPRKALAGGRKLRTKIIELSGSVEAACALGVADGIVDLVESGETMKAAGLKPVDTVVDSTALLIKSRKPSNPDLVDLIAARIGGVITAQRYVLCQFNIERSNLAAATAITPGRRAPTITSLEPRSEGGPEGWIAVSVMVEKKKIATVMDGLVTVGATDVLVLDIHNSRGA